MAEQNDNKTEAPTPRRRQTAREEGQVVFSPDFSAAVLLLSLALACWLAGSYWLEHTGGTIRQQITSIRRMDWGVSHTMLSVRWVTAHLLILGGIVTAGAWILNLGTSLLQSGFGIYTKPLEPDAEKMSPEKGWSKIWSLDNLVRTIIAPIKLIATVGAAAAFFYIYQERIGRSTHGTLDQTMIFCGEMACLLMLTLAGVAILFGSTDFLYRWLRHEEKLKMSRDEVKREHRDTEGDVEAKIRRMKLQKHAENRKSLDEVAKADAVITNPTHFAVAIKYDAAKSAAPLVIAKGTDHLARRIIALAKENGVTVLERKPLARALYALTEIGDQIPVELYRAVAEILAEAYKRKAAA